MLDENLSIQKIRNHAQFVKDNVSNGALKEGYLLACEQIVDIIHLLPKKKENINHFVPDPIPPITPPNLMDVVEVVRCKNCVSFDKNLLDKPFCCTNVILVDENDFCSSGKRRDCGQWE